MLGFLQHQISQVLDNLHRIFSVADIHNLVEIWDRRHAQRIVRNVFQDISVNNELEVAVMDNTDNYEFDNVLLYEWQKFLQDDDLYEMVVDNLSLSQLESSALEEDNANDSDDEMSPAVLTIVKNMALGN